ncbi:MAG: hypothetical protein WCT01_02825 [Candidatus Shapirobacteria bacterium]|jgi:hypothetical protein
MFKSILSYLSVIGSFWQDRSNRVLIFWILIIILAQLGLVVVFFNSFPPQIPLYRSLVWGESQLAPSSSLFLLPIFSLTLTIVNHLLAFILFRVEFLVRLLTVTSLVFCLLALVPIIQTIAIFIL